MQADYFNWHYLQPKALFRTSHHRQYHNISHPSSTLQVTPYLVVKGGRQALDFYKKAFDAKEKYSLPGPNGRVAHAEMQIGDSVIMLTDECPEWGNKGPLALGGTSVSLMIYVKNADEVFDQAVKAGATAERPVKLQFYGDRSGTLSDPFGHKWTISTHVEDVPFEELQKRMAEMISSEK